MAPAAVAARSPPSVVEADQAESPPDSNPSAKMRSAGPQFVHSAGQTWQVSPGSQKPSRSHTLQPDVSNPEQVRLHARAPLPNPWVRQVWPPRSAPSQVSAPSRTPFPHTGHPMQAEESRVQEAVQLSVPPEQPWLSQVAPPRLAPSHSSPG